MVSRGKFRQEEPVGHLCGSWPTFLKLCSKWLWQQSWNFQQSANLDGLLRCKASVTSRCFCDAAQQELHHWSTNTKHTNCLYYCLTPPSAESSLFKLLISYWNWASILEVYFLYTIFYILKKSIVKYTWLILKSIKNSLKLSTLILL